jgi:cytoskeletal protein CcmA (bactofilin family)
MADASVIGQGTVIRGHVRGDGSLDVFGRVEGDVSVSGDVRLGEHAAVKGSVTGADLRIAGAVAGDLHGSGSVLLESGARVVGDISAPRIGIADGALVRGNVRTDGEATPRARAASARREDPERAPAPVRRAEAKAPPKAAPAKKAEPARAQLALPAAKAKRPPPPVVPALRKGARAKKKSRRR